MIVFVAGCRRGQPRKRTGAKGTCGLSLKVGWALYLVKRKT